MMYVTDGKNGHMQLVHVDVNGKKTNIARGLLGKVQLFFIKLKETAAMSKLGKAPPKYQRDCSGEFRAV
jgi:hypothetical protein